MKTRAVEDALYAEGRRAFGEKGLLDLALLAGCYQFVCGALELFAISPPYSPTENKD